MKVVFHINDHQLPFICLDFMSDLSQLYLYHAAKGNLDLAQKRGPVSYY